MSEEYLEILIGKFLDGEITPAEKRLLDEQLAGDEQAADLFAQFQELNTQLHEAVGTEAVVSRDPEQVIEEAWQRGRSSSVGRVVRVSRRMQFPMGLAAGLLIGLAIHVFVSGPQAGEVSAKLGGLLPCRDLDDAGALLDSDSLESWLLALQMIDSLDGYALLGRVSDLTTHSDPLVAQQATRTYQRLLAKAGGGALRVLAEWKQQHPDFSALFLLAGAAANKLQLLRWLMRDRKDSNPAIDAVLRTALSDADWEVRVTAMVAAARLRAANVATAVGRAQ